MKIFDVVGAVVVVGWVVLASLYVYDVESSSSPAATGLSGEFTMQEGETWLVLRRDEEEVGYAHQTRTEIGQGWLVEYDMLMTIDLLGTKRSIETKVKSRLDAKGYLDEFNADIDASGRSFNASGQVEGTTLTMSLNLTGKPRTQTIELDEKPRLSASAFHQLLASGELEAGEEFKERFFDPTTMQMTEMVMLYQGPKTVDVFEEKVAGHHIIQKVAGNELDVYVDENGEILIQEFPLRMVGARVPNELGRARASAIRQRFEQQKKQKAQGGGELDLSLGTALELLGGTKTPAASEPADSEPSDSEPADSEPADSQPADSEPAVIQPEGSKQ